MKRLFLLFTLLFAGNAIADENIVGSAEDGEKMAEHDRKWQEAIDTFAQAPVDEVLTPYMRLISNLNHHPEHNWCTDNVLGLVNQAIALNPSSLVAYSMLYTCATKQHQTELKAQYLKSINGIIRNLVGGKEADKIENVIDIRELMEAPLLLQAMGYTILDIDMVTRFGGLFYRYHVMDPLNSSVTVRYFSNLAFMKRMLSNPNVSNDTAAQLLAQYYEQQKMDFALNASARRLIARKQYQKALEQLNAIEGYSMAKNVLLAQVFMQTEQEQALQEVQRELSFDAKSGFLDAKVMLAAIQLRQQPEEHAQSIIELLEGVDSYTKPGEGAYRLAMFLGQSVDATLKAQGTDYLKQAVALDHPKATFALAQFYRSGKQAKDNEDKAMVLLQKAADLGLDEAALEIARYLHTGSKSVAVDHEKALAILQRLANQGNHMAIYMLGQRYHDGKGVEKDPQKALQYYQSAYEKGSNKAANQIGILYESGEATGEEDKQTAFGWYEKAADRGDSNGFSNVARYYHFGILGETDLSKAANNYVRAAETGSYIAYCKLADTMILMGPRPNDKWEDTLSRIESLYMYGSKYDKKYCPRRLGHFYQDEMKNLESAGYWFETAARAGDQKALEAFEVILFEPFIEKDYNKALDKLRKGADLGLAKSNYYLGQMYHKGLGTERDDSQAMDYFKRAATLGHKGAQKAIVQLLLQGQDSVVDKSKARQLLDEQAARSLEATLAIAEWFFYGVGFDKDYALARHFYQKAAEQGSGNAINHLGEMYRYGWGVEVDYDQAKRWYLKGVKSNYILSAHNIAEMYYLGEGVEKNYLVAFDWFQKSAAKNVSHSRYFLGKMYQQGLGVSQDITLANRLFYQAMDQKNQGAKFELGKNMVNGIGMSANPGRGLIFITEAAEAGFEEAIEYLKATKPGTL